MPDLTNALAAARNAVTTEIAALGNFSQGLDEKLTDALELLVACKGHVIVTGLGKSGLVGAKISATLASTGTPSFFLHSADALHGDSGAITTDDLVIAISNSGETAEVIAVAKMAKEWGNKVIAITGKHASTLATSADALLDIAFEKEADPLNLAPTTSTTLTLVLGDAIASALMSYKNFTAADFGKRHPGGALGKATNK
jgi:arabinose-5-phosphate isomerase